MKGKALVWMCRLCKWVTISDQVPHRMDYCKCKKIWVDYEVGYCRWGGSPLSAMKFIAEIDLDKAKLLHVWTEGDKPTIHKPRGNRK